MDQECTANDVRPVNGTGVDDYFQRIGYQDTPLPTLATLRALHLLHPQRIAFENLDSLLGLPVRIDLPSLRQKLIHGGRGGYCYEHNLLLQHVLEEIGFEVQGLSARVLWNVPPNMMLPRSHMLLLVSIDGARYIADVGFGGVTMTAPLPLEEGVHATPHEPFRLTKQGNEYTLEVELQQAWKPMYRFGLEEHFLPDYEVANWYISTHPESLFVNELMAAKVEGDRRYALRNNQLAIHSPQGESEKRSVQNGEELLQVLRSDFGLHLPDSAELRALAQRLCDRG